VPQLIDLLAPSKFATRLLDGAYTLAIYGWYSAVAIVWFIPDDGLAWVTPTGLWAANQRDRRD
jgi:hypothetical protein